MIEAIIYNIAVMVAGIYLFHRLQYSENKIMIFSKGYVTILMTLVALLLTLPYSFSSSISYSPNFRSVTIPWSLYKRRLHFYCLTYHKSSGYIFIRKFIFMASFLL